MTSPISPVRWGILGAARIARSRILPAMQASPWCQLQAIGARELAGARQLADEFSIASAHGSYDAVLDDPLVEAVYIPLPNHLHVEMALKAVRKGKHVLCEKPLALSAPQARQLLAAPAGVLISEAFMVRHQSRWKALRTLLASGSCGRPRSMHSTLSFPLTDAQDFRNRPEFGGGALLDMGCYTVMAARHVFGREPLRALAVMDPDAPQGVDCTTTAILDFGAGCHATFTVSTDMALAQTLHVVCERGAIELPRPYAPAGGQPSTLLLDTSPDHDHPAVDARLFADEDQFEHEVSAFSRAVRGQGDGVLGLDDAIANLRVLDAVRALADAGGWVRV